MPDKKQESIVKSSNRFEYENERLFMLEERNLRFINAVAYRKLVFEIYPNLKSGTRLGNPIGYKVYEVELPTDKDFQVIYGKCKLTYEVDFNGTIKLIKIEPTELLGIPNIRENTTAYKGVIVAKNDEKSRFKIRLFSSLKEK